MRASLGKALVLVTVLGCLGACSGDDDPGSEEATDGTSSAPGSAPRTGVPPVVGPGPRVSYDDIPGARLTIDPTAARDPLLYRTVAISRVSASPADRVVAIRYAGGPDLCSLAVGYAVDRSSTELAVTVIEAQTEGCDGPEAEVTTRIPVGGPVGDLEVVPSEFSDRSLAITDIPT